MRLVLDKRGGGVIKKPYFQDKYERINFHEFLEGGMYSVPQTTKDDSLIGEKYILFDVNFDCTNGSVNIMKPTPVVFERWKRWDEILIDLHIIGTEGRLVNNNWYQSLSACVYKYENKDLALINYNTRIETLLRERRNWLQCMVDKEVSSLEKYLVKRVK